jgi:hypothetical protein
VPSTLPTNISGIANWALGKSAGAPWNSPASDAIPLKYRRLATEQLLTHLLQPQGRTRCHYHPGPLCRQEVRDHLAPRQRHQVAPLPPRPRRWYRDLPPEGHPPHVKEQAGQEEQGQAFRQAGQLYVDMRM